MASQAIAPRTKRDWQNRIKNLADRLCSHCAYHKKFPVSTYDLYSSLVSVEDRHAFEKLLTRHGDRLMGSKFLPVKIHKQWRFTKIPFLKEDTAAVYSLKLVLQKRDTDMQMLTGLREHFTTFKGENPFTLAFTLDETNEHYETIFKWANDVVLNSLASRVASQFAALVLEHSKTSAQLNALWPNATKVLGWDVMDKVGSSQGRISGVPRKALETIALNRDMVDQYLARCSLLGNISNAAQPNRQVCDAIVGVSAEKIR